jgi:hypothetical protein
VFEGPEKMIWVFPHKLNGPIHSHAEEGVFFLISDSTELDYSGKSWRRMDQNFEIKGFDFEPGYFYKLQVRKRNKNQGSGFVLKSILQKQKDFTYRIHGKWISIPNPDLSLGSFELNISKFTRIASIPSCFIIESPLGEVGERKIELFTNSISGLYPCGKPAPWDPKPTGPSGISILSQAEEYQITPEGFFDLYDSQRKILIRFKPSE